MPTPDPKISRKGDVAEVHGTQAAVRENDTRNRLLIESWAEAVWEADPDGLIVKHSASWRSYTGQTVEEPRAIGWFDAIHPDDRACAERQWREAVAAKSVVNAEFRIRSPDGSWRWTNVRAAPVLDEQGAIEKWVGMNIDIDARKRADEAVAESEERQAFLLSLTDDLRSLTDAAEMATIATKRLAEQLGVTRASFFEIDADQENFTQGVSSEAGLLRLPPRMRLSDFGPDIAEAFRAGCTYMVCDTATDRRLEANRDAYGTIDVRAWIATPLVSRGRLFSVLGVNHNVPRQWTASEVTLVEEVGKRLWSAVGRANAEAALRQSEERQAFLLELSDALSPVSDPVEVQEIAARMLGEHMDTDRCYYAEFDWPRDVLTIHYEYFRAPTFSVVGEHPISAFQNMLVHAHKGDPIVCDEISTHPVFKTEAAAYRERQTDGFILMPLVKQGQMVACMCVTMAGPRKWTADEVELVREVAARTRDAAERTRAERALRDSEEKYRALFESMDEAYAVVEVLKSGGSWADFRFLDANPAFMEHTSMPYPVGKTATELLGTPNPRWTKLYGRVVETGLPLRVEESESTLGRTFDLNIFALDRSRNRVAVLFTNVTDRKRAEKALQESEEQFRQFGEASADVLWIRDAKTLRWTYLSKGFERIYGMSREEALSGDTVQNWLDLILPEDRTVAASCIASVLAGKHATFEYRIRRRSDGAIRWLRNTDFPMHGDSATVDRIGGVGTDITDLKEAQEHQHVLLAELQHRVRNTLAVVRSIARRTADNSRSVDDMLAHFQGRLDAFSRVQAALTRRTDAKIELKSIFEDELLAHAAQEGGQVRMTGPEVLLAARDAERLSLAIHELATNAVKHGALTRPQGRIQIKWDILLSPEGRERLDLNWIESGVDIDLTLEPRHGFGMELLTRSLPYDLGAASEVDLTRSGFRFQLQMPLAPIERVPSV